MKVGICPQEPSAALNLQVIQRADALGVGVAWLTTGALDPVAVLAAAAVTTRRIGLGTSVLQSRVTHPVRAAHSAAVLDQLAPGRFRLGIGTGHKPQMERLGLPFERPLSHLREYVAVVRQALSGRVAFEGEFFRVDMPTTPRADVPVLLAALGAPAFELAGEIADGAIAWMCPARYLRRVARPALSGVPLIGQVFLGVTEAPSELRAEAEKRLQGYLSLPFYARMLERAGVKDACSEVVIAGPPSHCAERLQAFADEAGADEMLVTVLLSSGPRRDREREATLELVGNL